MSYFRATKSRTGEYLGEIEAPDHKHAVSKSNSYWGTPGETPVATLTEYTPAGLLLATIGPALENNGLRAERNALWMSDCHGDYELEGVGDRRDAVFIHDFVVSESGKGIGSRLIRVLTRQADAVGAAIYLNPWASSVHPGLSQEELEAWYKRHGWDWTNPIDYVMVREPKKI